MFNYCFNLQSHDRKGVVTKIEYQLSESCISLQNRARKYNKNMQNEPNLYHGHPARGLSLSICNISGYATFQPFEPHENRPKNEPKRTQNEPNFGRKLGSFSHKLALIYKEIIAFWYSFRSKYVLFERDEQARLQSPLRREQKAVKDDLLKSINHVNPVKNYSVNQCESVSKNISVVSVRLGSAHASRRVTSVAKYRLVRDLTRVAFVNRLANVEKIDVLLL